MVDRYKDFLCLLDCVTDMNVGGVDGEEMYTMVSALVIIFQTSLPDALGVPKPSPADVVSARQSVDVLASRPTPRVCCRSLNRFASLDAVRMAAKKRCAAGRADIRGDAEFDAALEVLKAHFSDEALESEYKYNEYSQAHDLREKATLTMNNIIACDAKLKSIVVAMDTWSAIRFEQQTDALCDAFDILCKAMLAGELAAHAVIVDMYESSGDTSSASLNPRQAQPVAEAASVDVADALLELPRESGERLIFDPSAELEQELAEAAAEASLAANQFCAEKTERINLRGP